MVKAVPAVGLESGGLTPKFIHTNRQARNLVETKINT